MSNLDFKVDYVKELNVASESLGASLDQVYSNIKKNTALFSEYVKNLFATVKQVNKLAEKNTETEKIVPLNKDQKAFLKLVEDIPFNELRILRAYRPEGLQCTYLELINELKVSVERSNTLVKDYLDPYSKLVGSLVSKDSSIKSIDMKSTFFKNSNESRSKIADRINQLYDPNSTVTQCAVKDVISRNADWVKVFSEMNDLIKTINEVDINEIQKLMDQCNGCLDIVIRDISESNVVDASPETIKRLADYTYLTARELEFYALTHFRILTLRGCVENTVETIKEIKG